MGLYLVSDILYGIAFFSLYHALKQLSVNLARIFFTLNTIFVIVDVAVDIPLRLYLIELSSSYATGGNARQIVSSANTVISTSNDVALVATFFQFLALIVASYFGEEPHFR